MNDKRNGNFGLDLGLRDSRVRRSLPTDQYIQATATDTMPSERDGAVLYPSEYRTFSPESPSYRRMVQRSYEERNRL